MAMNTEDALREYLRLFVQAAPRRTHRAAGPDVRLRRRRRARRQGDPRRRQARLRGPRAPLRPRRRRRRGQRSHRRPDRRAAGDQRAGPGRDGPRPDAVDDRHPRGPRPDRARRRHDAGGDAGHRDHRPARPARPRDRRGRRRRSSPTGCCRRSSTGASPRSSTGWPRSSRCSSTPPGPACARSWRRRTVTEARRRVGGRHLERLRAGIPAGLPVLYVPELFTQATGRRVVVARGPGASPRSWTSRETPAGDGPARRGRRSGSTRCWRPRRWCSSWARAGSARRRSPPPSGSRRRCTRAARCSCSPSTRPAGSPTPSASAPSATPPPRCPTPPSRPPASSRRGELWAAMLDTKAGWDELIRRHAPDAERPRRRAVQPALPEHHQPLRAQPRLPRHGAAARPPRHR